MSEELFAKAVYESEVKGKMNKGAFGTSDWTERKMFSKLDD